MAPLRRGRPMRTMFRYRKERRFAEPPSAIWPFVADTERINEMVGFPAYTVEERADRDGRIRRLAIAKVGPIKVRWEESFGEWQENHRLIQTRRFLTGPFGLFEARADLYPEGEGTRLVMTSEIECVGLLGLAAKLSGQIRREGDKRVRAIETLIAEAEAEEPETSAPEAIKASARRRFEALVADLDRDPASHGLAQKLAAHLASATAVELRAMRPLALARAWRATPDDAVELFLAAQRLGLVAMGWDLLCPRCRGAKSRVQSLHELPRGAHCSACNISYGRDFTRNVELSFHPEPWLRGLPSGEMCLLGPGATPHVKFQAEIPSGSTKSFALTLQPGAYRFRTVEAGGQAEADIDAGGIMPRVEASASGIALTAGEAPGEFVVCNASTRPLFFVIEDRIWNRDALTGDMVIAMPAFRRLCPEQLLRPGDEVEIGQVAILFTDLQGSTRLYDDLGDATAYHLVRDHFAFLSERVERHGGFVVKTVGDAVMAAFRDPADAVRAALAIQDEAAEFNRGRGDPGITLKLGLNFGPCIAVTAGGVLDYFGSAVNTASRLEHECRGGEIIVSAAVLADPEAREALADRRSSDDAATLRGLTQPVRFVRIGPLELKVAEKDRADT
jgi:class 3 adenylate cyclase